MNDVSFGLSRMLNSMLATCAFQLRSSFSIQRIAVTLVLTLFPPVMLGIAIFGATTFGGDIPFVEFVIVLLVSIVCLLSLLLWATPNVYTELEGKSWIFLASRPRGRIACFLGKFLASFLSAFLISAVSLTACVFIAEQFLGMRNALQSWASLVGIYFLAALVYAAIMSMIGTIAVKRSMVIAAGYIIGWEAILAQFPSIISRLTARYHLQSIGFTWMGWFIPGDMMPEEVYYEMYGKPYIPIHLAALFAILVICLVVGCIVITSRQYITSDES